MFTLRLTQEVDSQSDSYSVKVALERSSKIQEYLSYFVFQVKDQEQENIRWYLEDFLQYPQEPAPKIAAKIEQRMAEIGIELFEKVFRSNSDTGLIWEEVRDRLNETRVEIITGVREATAIPWELMRDPKTNIPLALAAQAFVRKPDREVLESQIPKPSGDKIRILLVICRPGGESDVAFRSVATKLIKGLTESGREIFQLDVLRPPSYDRLKSVLQQAQKDGKPYDIVHFDGHGGYGPLTSSKMQGYLIFENPDFQDKKERIPGKRLGKLLKKTGVSLLLLNACRSAYAEVPTEPGKTLVDQKAQAYETLAQEVMNAGVAGVIAMRYNLYVVTAAQFVTDLYAALAQGQTLGEAVTQGRKQLNTEQIREIKITSKTQKLQDWTVPIVYEVTPIALFPTFPEAEKQLFNIGQNNAAPTQVKLDQDLPKNPDTGFFGRDETLLTLDRAFDTKKIVLLHSYAGNGKTSVAAEFGRWYAQTGGVTGWVLFTSFEWYMPLARLIDKIGQIFRHLLEAKDINWLALSDEERRNKAVEVLKEQSVLWIWDNIEPVAGFPAGTKSAWSETEQQELVKFLEDVTTETETKFLLTSRRNEQGWLGDIPHRIIMPAMLIPERVQLARALAEQQGHELGAVTEWLPLLQFSMGNPLTIRVLVGQALLYGLMSKEQIEDFIAKLRLGEGVIDDEREGRSSSLGASLSYGFEQAFNEHERQQLALLHLFQGFADVRALCLMGNVDKDWCVPSVRGLTRESGVSLFNRAAEIGLLIGVVRYYYIIHPALPWYFKKLFDRYYLPQTKNDPEFAAYAFVKVKGSFGVYCAQEYENGNRDIILELIGEEANLLSAMKLAQINSWWTEVINTMQGLTALYNDMGRRRERIQLVNNILPDLVEPDTNRPRPGCEEQWSFITQERVKIAMEELKWTEAERLQRGRVDWNRQRAASAVAIESQFLDRVQRHAIRSLGISLLQLGIILMEQGKSDCVVAYKETLSLYQHINDLSAEAVLAFNMGRAYTDIPNIRNLEQAEHWYKRSLELCEKHDPLGSSKCLGQLGSVAYEKFKEAQEIGEAEEKLTHYLGEAAKFCNRQIELLPANAPDSLAVPHDLLGLIYSHTTERNLALSHFRKSISYHEASGNLYGAAQTRVHVAAQLAGDGYFDDALLYAQEALKNYKTYGNRAIADIQNTVNLIQLIQQNIQNQGD